MSNTPRDQQIIYKKGILLKITTWENDGDHYQTQEHQGLTNDQAAFMIKIANLFTSANNPHSPGFGNCDISDIDVQKLESALEKIILEFKDLSNENFDFKQVLEDILNDKTLRETDNEEYLYELVTVLKENITNYPTEYSYDFLRVVQSIEAFEIKEDIKIDLIGLNSNLIIENAQNNLNPKQKQTNKNKL